MWTEKPGVLQSIGGCRVRNDRATEQQQMCSYTPTMQSHLVCQSESTRQKAKLFFKIRAEEFGVSVEVRSLGDGEVARKRKEDADILYLRGTLEC